MCGSRLHVVDCVPAEDKMYNRLDGWEVGTNPGGRVTRIKACLSNMHVYYFSMYRFPKANVGRMEKGFRRFIWQGSSKKRKYHMVRWHVISRPKKKGGLGIYNLEK